MLTYFAVVAVRVTAWDALRTKDTPAHACNMFGRAHFLELTVSMQTLLLVIVVVVVLGQAELVVVMVVEQPIVILCVAVTVVGVDCGCLFLVD